MFVNVIRVFAKDQNMCVLTSVTNLQESKYLYLGQDVSIRPSFELLQKHRMQYNTFSRNSLNERMHECMYVCKHAYM